MPTQTLKNKKSGKRVILISGSPIPIVLAKNTKKNLVFKLPANLLEPKNLLKAKQKDKANTLKAKENAERARKERLAAQARFAAALREEREKEQKLAEQKQQSFLLKAFENNNDPNVATFAKILSSSSTRRGPGARGAQAKPKQSFENLYKSILSSGNKTIRKANVLKAEHAASKSKNRPRGKFWNMNNSNSD